MWQHVVPLSSLKPFRRVSVVVEKLGGEGVSQRLIHFNKVARGGHFAAWEQPTIFTEELRAGFRSLRG
jgi:hypothetical protein